MRSGPRPAGSRISLRGPLILAGLAGCVNVALDLWLRPNGVGYVLITLASAAIALATGQSEGVMMGPMDQPLPGLEPDPEPNPEPPVEEQDHLAAKWGEEGPGDGTEQGMDSQP